MFGTLGLGLCLGLGLGSGIGLGLGSVLGLLLGLILLGTLSRYYCAHSIDRQRAIITVPARSPSATKTLVKYELRQQLARLWTMRRLWSAPALSKNMMA